MFLMVCIVCRDVAIHSHPWTQQITNLIRGIWCICTHSLLQQSVYWHLDKFCQLQEVLLILLIVLVVDLLWFANWPQLFFFLLEVLRDSVVCLCLPLFLPLPLFFFSSSFSSFTLSFICHFFNHVHISRICSNRACTISQRGARRRIDHPRPVCVAISRAPSQYEEHSVLLQNDALTMIRRIPKTLTMTSTDHAIISNQNLMQKEKIPNPKL